MKRLIPFLVFLLAVVGAHADGDSTCNDYIEKGMNRYMKGHFEAAKDYFAFCCENCPDLKETCHKWIKLCDEGTKAREQRRIVEIKRIENKKLIERRERNRYVYLKVYNDIPDSFSGGLEDVLYGGIREIDTSVHFTADSIEAYWIVQVAVNLLEEQRYANDIRYRINAFIQVQNAAELNWETKRDIVSDSDVFPETASLSTVASTFYEGNSHVINRIEAKVMDFIGVAKVNKEDKGDMDDSSLGARNENVVIYIVPEDNNNADRLKTGLNKYFIDAGYNTLMREDDDEFKKLLNDEYRFQYMYSNPKERSSMGKKLGVDKMCIVRIKDRIKENDNYLEFSCSFFSVGEEKEPVKRVDYPRPHKKDPIVIANSDIDRIQIVAEALAEELGLPVDAKELEKHINKANEQDSLRERKRDDLYIDSIRRCKISAFIPKKGELFLTGGAAVALTMRNVCYAKFKSTHQKNYADAANACLIGGGVCLATAIGVYIYHICNAWPEDNKNYAPTKGKLSLNPVFSDESISLSLSINF